MIRIHKTAASPAILTTSGVTETGNVEASYNATPVQYRTRAGTPPRMVKKMKFDATIYGHQSVKTLLISDQHEKCCFCESKFSETSHGDVEHFRPKGGYKKLAARTMTYPGYYWLAYNWDNLMFSCEKCNQSYKKNAFPLRNEATRKKDHIHANTIAGEDRLLINPIIEDPSIWITFHEEVPVAVGGNQKGQLSIDTFGLDRFNDERLEYLKLLKLAVTWVKIDLTDPVQVQLAMDTFDFNRQEIIDLVTEAQAVYNSAAKDTAKFALCVRTKFPSLPIV